MRNLNQWTQEAHQLAIGKGFWGDNPITTADDPTELSSKICLMHAELSELLEAVRDEPDEACDKIMALTREEEEVADVFLRLADYCGARHINLEEVVMLKHEFNKTRPVKHGKRL